MASLLDRLASGELEEEPRRQVLAWLEEDPRRWRLCGLALLEAQTWSQTLGLWAVDGRSQTDGKRVMSTAGVEKYSVLSTQYPESQPGRRILALGAAALSACLLVSFSLGFGLRGLMSATASVQKPTPSAPSTLRQSRSNELSEPVLASFTVQSGAGLESASQIHVPVVRGESQAPHDAGSFKELSDYERQQWERRGYKLSRERRYLFAKLPDGQQVVVPVDQILVNHVPPKVY